MNCFDHPLHLIHTPPYTNTVVIDCLISYVYLISQPLPPYCDYLYFELSDLKMNCAPTATNMDCLTSPMHAPCSYIDLDYPI